MEAINILFGTKTKTSDREDGTHTVVEEKYMHGSPVSCIQRTTETIKITDATQVLAEFLNLMDLMKANPDLFDPEFKVFSSPRNHQFYKVERGWSEKTTN